MIKYIEWKNFTSFLVGFFFLSLLVFTRGHNYSPFILVGIAVFYIIYSLLKKKEKLTFFQEEKVLLYILLFYFFSFVAIYFAYGEKLKVLDNPLKTLLFLLLLYLFHRYPLQPKIILHFISWGSFFAGCVALFQRFYLNQPKAFYTQMSIQSGDIAMSLAMFSFVIVIYFSIKKNYKISLLYFIFSLFGMLGSVLSTSRGAWIGVPFIIIFVLFIYRHHLSKLFLAGFGTIILLSILSVALVPETRMSERITLASSEITAYFEKDKKVTSVGARFDLWKSAIEQFKEKPILGWGHKGALENRIEQGKQKEISGYASRFEHAHNQYLDDLSKRGIIGLFAFLAVLIVPFRFFFKNLKNNLEYKTIALLGCVHIISVVFYCLTQSFFAHNSGNIFYFFLVIVFYSFFTQVKNKRG